MVVDRTFRLLLAAWPATVPIKAAEANKADISFPVGRGPLEHPSANIRNGLKVVEVNMALFVLWMPLWELIVMNLGSFFLVCMENAKVAPMVSLILSDMVLIRTLLT